MKTPSLLIFFFGLIAIISLRQAVADVQRIPLITNDIVYDAINDELLVTVPSIVRWRGNTITRIKPSTLEILGSVYVGSDPERLALSDSGATLYIALTGSPKIVRYDVANRKVIGTFSAGPPGQWGFLFGEDIDVAPGSETMISIARTNRFATDRDGAAIFDNGVQRPLTVNEGFIDRVAFGAGARVYGLSESTSSYPITRMNIVVNGLTYVDDTSSGAGGEADFEFFGGRLFTTNRHIYNGEPVSLFASLADQGPMVIDTTEQKLFIMAQDQSSQLNVYTYDLQSFQLLNLDIEPVFEQPLRAVKCGPNRIAYIGGPFYGPAEWVGVYTY